jgi:hypothetical protein
MSFSPVMRVSMVSGEASAVLIKSLFSTMGLPLSLVSSIILASFEVVIGVAAKILKD